MSVDKIMTQIKDHLNQVPNIKDLEVLKSWYVEDMKFLLSLLDEAIKKIPDENNDVLINPKVKKRVKRKG